MDINTRVQIPAHSDYWMMGARFGTIQAIVKHPSAQMAKVRLDIGGKHVFLPTIDLTIVK